MMKAPARGATVRVKCGGQDSASHGFSGIAPAVFSDDARNYSGQIDLGMEANDWCQPRFGAARFCLLGRVLSARGAGRGAVVDRYARRR